MFTFFILHCTFESSWWKKIPNDNYFLQTTMMNIPVYFLLFYILITKEEKKTSLQKCINNIWKKDWKICGLYFETACLLYVKDPLFSSAEACRIYSPVRGRNKKFARPLPRFGHSFLTIHSKWIILPPRNQINSSDNKREVHAH